MTPPRPRHGAVKENPVLRPSPASALLTTEFQYEHTLRNSEVLFSGPNAMAGKVQPSAEPLPLRPMQESPRALKSKVSSAPYPLWVNWAPG